MPINIDGFPVTPYGHPDDLIVYVNEQEYYGITYVKIVKKINQLESFEMRISDVIYSDANVLYGKIVKIFAESKLLLKGKIEEVKYSTDGTAYVKGYGMGVLLKHQEYTLRTTFNDTTTNMVNKFLSKNDTGIIPWIITPKTIDDFGETIDFRAQYDNKLQLVDSLARQLEWDWWMDNGDTPYNEDRFVFEDWRGSLAPVYTVNLSGTNQNAIISERNDNFRNLVNSVIYMGKGEGANQIWTKFTLMSKIYDRLDTTIPDSNSPFILQGSGQDWPSIGAGLVGNSYFCWVYNTTPNILGSGGFLYYDTEVGTANTYHYKGTVVVLFANLIDNPYFTSLDGNITATDTTINVIDGSDLASNLVTIGKECVYIGTYPIVGNTLQNCIRGYNGTVATAHDNAIFVISANSAYVFYTPSAPEDGSPVANDGLKQRILTDPTKESARQLEMEASNYLLRNKDITYEITFEMMDYFDFLNKVNLGDRIQIIDDDTGLNDNFRFLGMDLTWDMGMVKLLISASNKKITESSFTDSIANISKTLSSRLTYAPT